MHRRYVVLTWFCAVVVATCVSACATAGIIYEELSPYGPIIVTEHDGLRTMLFARDGARQSVVKIGDPDHLELPYTRAALTGLALCEAPERMLIVGLGGGSLPSFLRKHYPSATIDVAELNPRVLAVAKEFFGFREDDRMHVYLGDGRQYIEKVPAQRYDIVFLDAFSADTVPPHLTTQEFLEAVRRTMRPTGVVVANVWNRSSNPLYDRMLRTYQEVFDELLVLDVASAVNAIFLALPGRRSVSERALAQRARAISISKSLPFDLGETVTQRFSDVREKASAERVLHDSALKP